MTTKYAIRYNSNLSLMTGNARFDSIEEAEQNLLNNGYHLIENNIHQKFWATLNFDTHKFHEENIEIIEVKIYDSKEITEKIILTLSNQKYMPKLQNVSGWQNCIQLNIENQKFRIIVEEIET